MDRQSLALFTVVFGRAYAASPRNVSLHGCTRYHTLPRWRQVKRKSVYRFPYIYLIDTLGNLELTDIIFLAFVFLFFGFLRTVDEN